MSRENVAANDNAWELTVDGRYTRHPFLTALFDWVEDLGAAFSSTFEKPDTDAQYDAILDPELARWKNPA